jgi:hypothetical protein
MAISTLAIILHDLPWDPKRSLYYVQQVGGYQLRCDDVCYQCVTLLSVVFLWYLDEVGAVDVG